MTHKKLYAERDYDEIAAYRMQHVMAMTAEGLHSKGAIADELAYRDMIIDKLTKELSKESLTVQPHKPFAYTSKAGLNYENIGENHGMLPVRSCMVFGDHDHVFDQPIWLQPIIKNYAIDPELRKKVLELCDQIDSYTHTWALQTDAKAIREMLESDK